LSTLTFLEASLIVRRNRPGDAGHGEDAGPLVTLSAV
jgi:hypothetical protein